ncbi:MAG: flagellar basal body-associated FliL family protein [Caulobacteraceae bacterium]
MLFGKKKAKAPEAEADGEASLPATVPEGEEGLVLEGDGAPRKKKPPMVMIAAALAVVVVLAGGGAGAYFVMFKKPPSPEAAAKAAKEAKAKKAKAGKEEKKEGGKPDPNAPVVKDGPDGVVFYTLPDVVVNMQTADGRPSFLKLKLTLELPDHDTAEVLNPNMPRLQDVFQVFLREMRPEDLAGSQGGYLLRTEILRRVNMVIAPSRANAVLIEEMLVN